MVNQLQIKALSKQYGMSPPLLKNVSFTFESGTITGLMGKNGTGKSTLLKLLSLLSKPDKGEILFNEIDVWQKPKPYLAQIGIVSDWLTLPDSLSFDELLLWQLEKKGWDSGQIQQEIQQLKTEFDFDERSGQLIRTYSSGMRKKTAICAALCGNPSVLIMDEPFQALDEETRKTLTNRIIQERNKGTIILLATHFDHSEDELFNNVIRFPIS